MLIGQKPKPAYGQTSVAHSFTSPRGNWACISGLTETHENSSHWILIMCNSNPHLQAASVIILCVTENGVGLGTRLCNSQYGFTVQT